MAVTLEKIQKRPVRNYFVKVLIQDTAGKWVDISERVKRHKDRVTGIPKIKINTDSKTLSHRFYASSGSLVVDNSDGFWDGHVEFTLKTIDGAAATFNSSKASSELVWVGRKVQFRLIEFFGETYKEKALGTFLIDDIKTSLGETATVSLVDLSEPLRSRDASVVKNGMSWYQNRSISFLVKKLLELEYGTETGGILPPTYEIAGAINLQTFDGSKTLSAIGSPPQETDTDGDGEANLFYEKPKSARVICMAPSTIGYSNKNDNKNTIYIGCNEQLFSFNPSNNLYTELSSAITLGSGFYISYLWYNSVTGKIIGIAQMDLPVNTDVYTIANDYGISTNRESPWIAPPAKVFEYTSAGGLVVKTTISNFYSGKYLALQATAFNRATGGDAYVFGLHGTALAEGTDFCPNMYFNYQQYLQIYAGLGDDKIVKLEYGNDTITINDATASTVSLPGYANGYCTIMGYSDTDDFTEGYRDNWIRASWGQQGCVSFIENAVGAYTEGAILYATVSNLANTVSRDKYNLYIYNVASNTSALIDSDVTISIEGRVSTQDAPAIPISSCAKTSTALPTGVGFYVGVHGWLQSLATVSGSVEPNAAYDTMASDIRFYSLSSGSWLSTDFVDTSGLVPLEIYHNGEGSTGLFVSWLNRLYITSDETNILYKMYNYNESTFSGTLIYSSLNQPKGLVYTTDALWFVQQQTGYLSKYNTVSGLLSVVDDGFPITDENLCLISGLVVDYYTRSGDFILWGISSSFFDQQMSASSGIYYNLFKYDSVISEYVSVADFEGLSLWDALGFLAQRANCSMGFDEEGNFFFKKREIDSTASYTIDVDDGDIISIEKNRGKDEIYNYVEITPYNSVYKEPEYSAYLQSRETEEEDSTIAEDEIVLKQLDTLTKYIDLICVLDGDAHCNNTNSGYPLFKFAIYDSIISGRFDRAHTNETTLYVCSLYGGADTEYGIKIGYYLVITDSDENETFYEITGVNNSNNTIVISSPITTTSNQDFKVVKRNKISSSGTIKLWSDEGVTFIKNTTSTKTSTEHTVNSTDNLSLNSVILIGGQYLRITAIDYITNTITVSKFVTLNNGDIVSAYFAPYNSDSFFEIGNSKVFIRFNTPDNSKSVFKQGDRITVKCAGMVVEADDASKQTAVNTESMTKYGKNQYPNINNRFLTRKLAKQLAQKLRTLYAFPKYTFKITMPLSNYLDIKGTSNLARIDVRSQKLLPLRSGYTEPTRIVSIEHDTQKGITTLELKSDSFY